MQGVINIEGYIGSFILEGKQVKGVEYIDVLSQFQAQPEADSFLVKINSKGGLCSVGYLIHDFLKTCGKPINTEATGYCCSMATIIMMAGESREGVEPLEFRPHNPWTDGIQGDADDLQLAADDLRAEEDRMITFYSKATGIPKEGIDGIMKLDNPIPLEQAVELKFLTAIKKASRAVAVSDTKKNIMTTFAKTLESLSKKLDLVIKGTKKEEPKAVKMTTTDGKEVEILDSTGADFSGEPMPGDMITVGGEAANGTFSFENFTVEALMGVVTTVTPTAAAAAAKKAKEDKEAADKLALENKSADQKLIDENAALKTENAEMKKQIEAFGTKVDGIEKAMAVIKSAYVAPDGKTGFQNRGLKEEGASLKDLAVEARKRYKK